MTVKNNGKEISELLKMAMILRSHFCRIVQNTRCVIYVHWAITSRFWRVNKILPAVSLHGAEVTGFDIRVWSLVREKFKFSWGFSPYICRSFFCGLLKWKVRWSWPSSASVVGSFWPHVYVCEANMGHETWRVYVASRVWFWIVDAMAMLSDKMVKVCKNLIEYFEVFSAIWKWNVSSACRMAVESFPSLVVVLLFNELPDQNTIMNHSWFSRSIITCSDALSIGNKNLSEIKLKLLAC